jgi:3-methylcrotonyl-CoA carboxylase alpha subunit
VDNSVRPLGEGWYLVQDGPRQWQVAVVTAPDGTWVFVEGQATRVGTIETGGRPRHRGDAGVMAPMPATVVSIDAEVGQNVIEGETVIVLEAMKMELPIKAPRTGRVKAIHCAQDELVQPGVNLLEIE